MSDEQLVATNEELVKRLRGMDGDSMSIKTLDEAADRIEALEAKLAECEVRLGKAVEALERAKASIESGEGGGVTDVVWLDDPCPETLCDFIDATLAEIKGDSHE
jgi:hypothetical protein